MPGSGLPSGSGTCSGFASGRTSGSTSELLQGVLRLQLRIAGGIVGAHHRPQEAPRDRLLLGSSGQGARAAAGVLGEGVSGARGVEDVGHHEEDLGGVGAVVLIAGPGAR